MLNRNRKNNRIALFATLVIFPFLAACGDDDDKGGAKSATNSSSGSSVGTALLCVAIVLTSGNDSCASSGGSSSSGGSGGTSDPHALNRSVQYAINREVEPNNDRGNANVLVIPLTALPDGFVAEGSVNDLSDDADYYTMARPNTRHFRFVLCSDGSRLCNQYGEIDSLTAYIDVLDSSGNVIASSQAAERNLVEPLLYAGLPYFVRVVAGDTMGSAIDYRLTAHEFE